MLDPKQLHCAITLARHRNFARAAEALDYTLALLGVAGLALGPIGLRGEDRRALVWGFPARNLAIAALIATTVVGQLAMATFGAVLFAVHLTVMIPLALFLGRANVRRQAA